MRIWMGENMPVQIIALLDPTRTRRPTLRRTLHEVYLVLHKISPHNYG